MRRSRERSSSSRAHDTAESGTPRNDGFAAFMRAQRGRISAAADPADARRQFSAEWLKLTVAERRECAPTTQYSLFACRSSCIRLRQRALAWSRWRRRDADRQERSDTGRQTLGSTTSSRTAGSSTPPRASRRKSPSGRSKHVRMLSLSSLPPSHSLQPRARNAARCAQNSTSVTASTLTPLPLPLLHRSHPADPRPRSLCAPLPLTTPRALPRHRRQLCPCGAVAVPI